jgi:peptidoglycan/LPS O-acetylase OafA/YrhL
MMNKSSNNHILVLDGLRFFAALSVMLAHYTFWVIGDQGITNNISLFLGALPGIGMPLFFVLSGFVIHWNYHELVERPQGIKKYLVARFARLYPLYLTVLLIEFVIGFHLHRGSAAFAGSRWALFFALPYYLTLTQDWIFGVIGQNNLIYQYHMATAVSWSISLEFFFYLAYLFFVKRVNKITKVSTPLILILLLQIAVIFYLILCSKYTASINKAALAGFGEYATTTKGYQDSLLRWLNYFNPWVNLPAFIFGVCVAKICLLQQTKSLASIEKKWGGWFTGISILVLFISYYLTYFIYTSLFNNFVGRAGSLLYTPLIVLLIYCLVRYQDTWLNKIISCRLFVKLGLASYSIYLLHAFFGWYPRDFYYLGLNPWLLYVLAIISVLVISYFSYLLFERPAQMLIRRQLLGREKTESSGDMQTVYAVK